ncbi:MAG: CPBP family glutamic-type intramembrane protease [Pirellulales bacterium]|nr:CPBP family glutamic-type intramembrane protease [Pirellulales bacterium]
MKWKNVKLIYTREMRDQLRDRRTLFLIAVLPLLLYPLLGMSFFQVAQFLRNTAAKVMVVGGEELTSRPWLPPLLVENNFSPDLFQGNPLERERLQLVGGDETLSGGNVSADRADRKAADSLERSPGDQVDGGRPVAESLAAGADALENSDVQVVIYFPPGFGERLELARKALIERGGDASPTSAELPEPKIYYNSADEKSRVAQLRVERMLWNWRNKVMQMNLRAGNVPVEAARPFELQPQDVAEEQQRNAAVWSKLLPFILFIWALTGAFYPAVDVCAGEKERGTLETLLTSPAQRREIVWGKLLTIMTFSMVTATLNLGIMGITGKFVLAQFKGITSLSGQEAALSMPPWVSVFWLGLALLPVAALFSALCLACAAFARSTKEGQYYLMPLLLAIMPLMVLPMAPGIELNLGNGLIPITGVVLLLRAAIEGQYWEAMRFVLPVVGVTLVCCLLAIRWAEKQFNSESVLFRESERLDLGRWFVHLVRDRTETPNFAQGIFCVGLILVVQFFVNLALSSVAASREQDIFFFAQTLFIGQVVCIAMPAVLLAFLFTSRRKKTLLLDRLPSARLVLATVLLAVLVRPLGLEFAEAVIHVYPPSAEMAVHVGIVNKALGLFPNLWTLLLMLAILPAICEEIAFRGFVLSGLRHVGHKWWAIGLSAIAFGMVHPILQQQIAAAAAGVVLGYLAVQTGSLLLCILFHAIYNGLGLLQYRQLADLGDNISESRWSWVLSESGPLVFQAWVLVVALAGSGALLWWLHCLPYQRTAEEQLQEARDRQFVGA